MTLLAVTLTLKHEDTESPLQDMSDLNQFIKLKTKTIPENFAITAAALSIIMYCELKES